MKFSKRISALLTAFALMLVTVSCDKKNDEPLSESDGGFEVTFFDEGKADCMVLKTDNSTVVIDCGVKGTGKRLTAFLEERNVSDVDCLIISHYDRDHIGGAAKLIKNFNVKQVYAPDYADESEELTKYNDALKQKNITPQLLTSDVSFTADNVEYTVFAPKQSEYSKNNDNNHSLVTKAVYGDTSFVFSGDCMEERLSEIMDIGRCDLLKIPYHGRKLDNLGEFLDKTAPQYAVVLTSKKEFSSKVKSLLSDRNITYYASCYNDTITAVSDGKAIKIK
ncbi:MAG: MBL fold metallo-hydrolase [Ruminococcus sp.]|nr:MBL fold metallo-hydrolase [Ruminococcus sp.]